MMNCLSIVYIKLFKKVGNIANALPELEYDAMTRRETSAMGPKIWPLAIWLSFLCTA